MRRFTRCVFFLVLSVPATVLWSQERGPIFAVTYPAAEDTFNVAKLRIAGYAPPEALVRINSSPVRVYSHGAFIGRVDLQPGWNAIPVSCTWRQRTLMDTVRVFRPYPLVPLAEIPTVFDAVLLEPAADLLLSPGDQLEVACKGSPAAEAEVYIEGTGRSRPLAPAIGLPAGCYRSILTVGDWPLQKPLQIVFSLTGRDGRRIQQAAPGRVTVMSPEDPLLGYTQPESNVWNAACEGVVLTVLPDSVPVQITGKVLNRWRIRLGKTLAGYIDATDLQAEPKAMALPATPVSAPSLSFEQDWLRLDMRVNHPVPFTLEQSLDPAVLELTLYGAFVSSAWITHPNVETFINQISWTQLEEQVVRWRIELKQKQQWGHYVAFQDKRLSLYIRRAPAKSQDPGKPLAGLTIVLDPGHGGCESGARSSIGLEEKEINLQVARYLAEEIRRSGGTVVFTRTTDTLMTIAQRICKARRERAHLYLWLHNNSVGPEVDAGRVRGTSTYYYVPQNRALAEKVYNRLRRIPLSPYGCIQQAYTVTRVCDMLVILVEGAFMSHPEDERLLMKPSFLRRMAGAIDSGIIDFLRTAR